MSTILQYIQGHEFQNSPDLKFKKSNFLYQPILLSNLLKKYDPQKTIFILFLVVKQTICNRNSHYHYEAGNKIGFIFARA